MSETRYELIITPELAGERLDKALTALLQDSAELSRARVQALIKSGHVTNNGKKVEDTSQAVASGATYELIVPPAIKPEDLPAQDIPLEIVHEDKDVIVINKPPGLVVHPAAGNWDGTLVNALLWHRGEELSGIGGEQRPGIVHRLDKDTSGLMVVAKHDKAHQKLSAQFSDHSLSRTYFAIVWGVPMPRAGTIAAPIGRHPKDRKRMAVLKNGKEAITHYEVVQVLAAGALALVRCQLETGRTHQIRVHLMHIGHALVGDPVYTRKRASRLPEPYQSAVKGFSRQALHAGELEFIHPRNGKPVSYQAGLPADLRELIEQLQATKSPRKT
jgi:23S rRNA pseudouridine1911/1915/1917 synthase